MKRSTTAHGLALLCAATLAAPTAWARTKIRTTLTPTPVGADAKGRATLALRSASDGKFDVVGRRVDADAVYQVIVGGVRVADLATAGGGNGKARFRTRPRSRHDVPLGFDPRNQTLVIRDAAGDDVLATTFPDDSVAGAIVCCIPDDSGAECEDRTADECAAAGGTVAAGATSCLPNPCADATPVEDENDVVCCIPDDSGPECEDRTQAECLAAGGTVVAGTSCDPNPCAPTPPAAGEGACCLADHGGDGLAECEDLSPDACTAVGGTVADAPSCSPDPCNASGATPPADEIACCVPSATDGSDCEMLAADACTTAGGTPATSATCDPDPCGRNSNRGSGGGDESAGHA